MKAKLYIEKDERPRYFPARQVPFFIREKVGGIRATASVRRHPASPIRGLGGSHCSCLEERRSLSYLWRL